MKYSVIALLIALITGCSSNPYHDPSKSEPHAKITIEDTMGIWVSSRGLIIEQINGKDTNHAGRWSGDSFRLKPGRNIILASVHGGHSIIGFVVIDFRTVDGEKYIVKTAYRDSDFLVSITDSKKSVVFEKTVEKRYAPRQDPTAYPVIISLAK